ncbi:MAG: aminopeptidase N [Pseudomonadota bacterium]
MRTDTPKTIYLKDYTPPAFLISDTALLFQVYADRTDVTATLSLKRQHPTDALVLHGEDQILHRVILDGRDLMQGTDYDLDDKFLTIHAPIGAQATLVIHNTIYPDKNTALEGLYASNGTLCTQCEAEGFRRITYYLDRPDVLAAFKVRIETDKAAYPVLLSNGNLEAEGDLPDGRHFVLWNDPFPKPCYLFALVAGPLVHIRDEFLTRSGRKVDLRIYVRPGDETQCYHAMDSLKRSMKWDEDVYGREYHLDRFNILAVSDFNMGGMENTSLNIFNTSAILADKDLATDADFLRVEAVVGHEYFHNWSGNLVTCRDWFQLSLKEGFTVLREQEFCAEQHSTAVQRIDDVAMLRRHQFPEDNGPLAHPIRPDNYIEINNFYTMTVYEKGAEVIRMMQTLIGPQAYRKGTDLYFDTYQGQAATCDDFVASLEKASGYDMTQMKLWYSQAGTPTVTIRGDYDATAQTYTLHMAQSTPATPGQQDKKPMVIPVTTALFGQNGAMIGEEQVLVLDKTAQDFTFKGVTERPVPSLLRRFSAPVKLDTDLTPADLRHLIIHDTDGFNRWDAMQSLAMIECNRLLASGAETPVDPDFIAMYSVLLDHAAREDQDITLLARMLPLPDSSIIAQAQSVVHPTEIHATRLRIMKTLAAAHTARFAKLYDTAPHGDYRVDTLSIAKRALSNLALRYLYLADAEAGIARAATQYANASNMTDRMVALSVLADTDSPARTGALQDFYTRYSDHALVIDKWFSVQAAANRPTILADIRALAGHEAMTLKNPNRFRALYSAFAMNNMNGFHHASGDGYRLLGELIKALNATNPQVGARMLNPLREWRRYAPDRQALMESVLQDILAQPNLAKDIFEIASKSLAPPQT